VALNVSRTPDSPKPGQTLHSGATVPDFHRLPFGYLKALCLKACNQIILFLKSD
jgi:hypothetical protein